MMQTAPYGSPFTFVPERASLIISVHETATLHFIGTLIDRRISLLFRIVHRLNFGPS
jgi:hypothetical protein